ncbi:MAG TPA: acylphosphatase [Nitrososphaera sp.]|nr:acylphosphatase [Nitrososphaera sp.]
MTNKVRAHVFVSGKVQGVYFRQNTMETAKKNGVTGWARNLPDGRVEAVLEGDKVNVDKVVEWCRHGPQKAEVQELGLEFERYIGEFSDFVISY